MAKTVNYSACIIVALSMLFSSCDNNLVFEENEKIENQNWNIKQVVKLQTEITDSLSRNNMYINVRHGGNYPNSNLFVFVNTLMPNGKQIRDTLECVLADDKGHWLGKGSGDIIDHRIPFKRNIIFPVKGVYKFEIEQAMRIEELPSVLDIGLRIEKK